MVRSGFGSVVAAIDNMPALANVPVVQDVERVFPVYRDSENPIKKLRQTAFGDYLEVIRARLQALEAAESEPKVVPNIYESWTNAEQVREAIHTDAASLFRKVEAALPDFTPIRVAPDLLGQCEVNGLFAWGIFNPMGPTICTVSLLRHETADTSLVHYQMLNLFAQERIVIGALGNDASMDKLTTLLNRLFAVNDVDGSALIGGLPTFLIFPEGDPYRAIAFSCLRSHILENDRVSEVVVRLKAFKRFEGNPWDRAKSDVSRLMESSEANQLITTISESRMTIDKKSALAALAEWLELLVSARHLKSELGGFLGAWEGSIDLHKDNSLGKTAMAVEPMLNCVIESTPEFALQISKAIQS